MTENKRYAIRYFCQSENPNEDKNWIVVDKKTGMPIFDENGIRYFDKGEALGFVAGEKSLS